jgi:CRISPR-associated protein Csb1
MTADEIYARVRAGASLRSEDAGIRVLASYQPLGGTGGKVFPPTYLADRGSSPYVFEERYDDEGKEVRTVLLDSYQSQANRTETALLESRRRGEIALPLIELVAEAGDQRFTVSSLEAPHRSSDAYFRDAEDGDGVAFDRTQAGKAIRSASERSARGLFRYCPTALVYGTWDSHRGGRGAKVARSYVSELTGYLPLEGKRTGSRIDPLVLANLKVVERSPEEGYWDLPDRVEVLPEDGAAPAPGKRKKDELTAQGHGMIPPTLSPSGGVSITQATRRAFVSFPGLARLRFPDPATGDVDQETDGAAAATLAALALLGDRLAFGAAALHLRSGCDLVLVEERLEWVRRGGETEPLDLGVDEARKLFHVALDRSRDAGLEWQSETIELRPRENLRRAIELSFAVAPEPE